MLSDLRTSLSAAVFSSGLCPDSESWDTTTFTLRPLSYPRTQISRTVPHVRLTCPGVPWSVHGPKTKFSNAFTLSATTLRCFATVHSVAQEPDGTGVPEQPRPRAAAARPHGRLAAPATGLIAYAPGRQANRPTDSANQDTALATGWPVADLGYCG